jgi:hypothetical protein
MTFEKKWEYSSPLKEASHKAFFNVYQSKKMFAGHIKVIGGPRMACGPNVAQACAGVNGTEQFRITFKV